MYYTCKDVAKRLGVQPDTVSKYIRRGLLKAERVNNGYRIESEDFEEFHRIYIANKQLHESSARELEEEIDICLHCIVPNECNPKSRNCRLNYPKKF